MSGEMGMGAVFFCCDRVWGKGQESLRRDKEFDIVIELPKLVSQRVNPP